jgi:hypothetical protein
MNKEYEYLRSGVISFQFLKLNVLDFLLRGNGAFYGCK